MTINRFAEISEVNSGTLSNILNGNRPISMQQLDRITSGMGLEEGYFYELYIDECIFHATPDWRRLGPFLHRCAELGKLDCLDKAVRMTMDNISYSPLLFETAELFSKRESMRRPCCSTGVWLRAKDSSIRSGWPFVSTGCLRSGLRMIRK